MDRMHADHAAMLAAFKARDADELLRCSREHYRRLETAVDTRLRPPLAGADISRIYGSSRFSGGRML